MPSRPHSPSSASYASSSSGHESSSSSSIASCSSSTCTHHHHHSKGNKKGASGKTTTKKKSSSTTTGGGGGGGGQCTHCGPRVDDDYVHYPLLHSSSPPTTYNNAPHSFTPPTIVDSLVHLSRRAIRQLTMATGAGATGGGSASDTDYLPLYSGATAAAAGGASHHPPPRKQRMSSEVSSSHCCYFPEKEEVQGGAGHEKGCSSCNKGKESTAQRQRSHSQPLRNRCPSSSTGTSWLAPSSSSSSSSHHNPASNSRRCHALATLIKLAILLLALLGVASIVGFATGLLQRTPLYTEKALQDAGWARRPITLSTTTTTTTTTTNTWQNGGEKQQQQQILSPQDPYAGVTVHDFSPPLSEKYALSSGSSPLSSTSSPLTGGSSSSLPLISSQTPVQPVPSDELHLLILCPLRNSAPDLPHLFELLDSLHHPKMNTSLGFLVGDEDDDTGDVLRRLVQERMAPEEEQALEEGVDGKDASVDKRYRHISLLHKDFNVQMPSGANRHSYPVQLQRRTVMARARTYLLTSTLEPSVDWVLWIDSDIAEVSPTLFQDLLIYGQGGVVDVPLQDAAVHKKSKNESQGGKGGSENGSNEGVALWNDVIVPNAMKRLPDGQLLGFDMNNWAETPESLRLKANLAADDLLIEGNIWQHMHRIHLADQYTPYTSSALLATTSSSSSSSLDLTSSPNRPESEINSGAGTPQGQLEIFSSAPSYINSLPSDDQRLNVSSPAYIGRLQPLDGIGGVAALVRAEVHRMGATFPSWIFENQLETEAFGVLAKRLGARVVGLPNLFVLHAS